MANDYVLQWNCRGLRANREELELLISDYKPKVICLQETKLTPNNHNFTFKNYTTYYRSNENGSGGVGILVKNTIPQSPIPLISPLQSIAVRVTVRGKAYSISCNYVPPSCEPTKQQYDHIVFSDRSETLASKMKPVVDTLALSQVQGGGRIQYWNRSAYSHYQLLAMLVSGMQNRSF